MEEIGTFENLNEDVMDEIIGHLPNADVLNLNNAYPGLKNCVELMRKRVQECKIEYGLACASFFLTDDELLHLDEAFPKIKENYAWFKTGVEIAVEIVSVHFWNTDVGLRNLIHEAHDTCQECGHIWPFFTHCTQYCSRCPKFIRNRLRLYDMKNKLYCNVCKFQCYDKWQLRLHNDKRKLNEKNNEENDIDWDEIENGLDWTRRKLIENEPENGVDWKIARKKCPIGFPRLSKKIKWGEDFNVEKSNWISPGRWWRKKVK